VDALQESQRRLTRLGLFDSVDIAVVNPESLTSAVATRVSVMERDPTQLTYSFGYGSEERAYGEAVWRHLNFLGGGRTLSMRGKWSWLDRGGEAAFRQPYLFGSRLAFTASTYVWHFDEEPYESLSRGGRAGLIHEAGRTTFTGTYIHEFLSVQVLRQAQDEQQGLLSAVQFNAERDASVQSAETTRGYVVAARLEHAGGWLPGSFHYVSVFGDGRYYRALARTTLAGRIQYGSMVPNGPRSNVPFSKRYFLGGADSLRGWGRLEVSPLSAAGLPLGGQSLFAITGELRVSLAGPVGAVVFADAGKVWEDAWALSRDLHSDGGIGFRYRSPFALLRFDVAYQFTTVAGLQISDDRRDRRWRIHFGIGHSF
jgi:outer membrane protein insertion porin family